MRRLSAMSGSDSSHCQHGDKNCRPEIAYLDAHPRHADSLSITMGGAPPAPRCACGSIGDITNRIHHRLLIFADHPQQCPA